jgi:hypothetical protein
VLHSPGGGCAEKREGGELDKAPCSLGVHFPLDLKGQRLGCPSPVRELMALSRSLHETPREREGRPSF